MLSQRTQSLEHLLNIFAGHIGFTAQEITTKTRRADIVSARQAFCFIAQSLGFHRNDIAVVVNLDPDTVAYSVRKTKDFIEIEDVQTLKLIGKDILAEIEEIQLHKLNIDYINIIDITSIFSLD